jgi:methyl-accepting chemotaxis protein
MGQASMQLALTDPFSMVAWTARSAQLTARRAVALARLIDRAGQALDDIADLRRAAQFIADNLAELSKSAQGIDRNSAEIAREITGLTKAAQGIDMQAGRLTAEIQSVAQILPTLQRLTEIVDPLDNTVARLGRFVDRLPGGRRTAARSPRPVEPQKKPT